MTSQINPNNIDGNYPVAGQPNNTQGFRDNFTSTKSNFQYAADEITEIQSKGVFKQALTGTTLDNNMNDNLVYAVKLNDVSWVEVQQVATSGTITLDYSAANYQAIPSATGNITLDFSNWPAAGTVGRLNFAIVVSNTSYTLTLPATVKIGVKNLNGVSPGNAGVTNTITFPATGTYIYVFETADGGTTISIQECVSPTNTISNQVLISNALPSSSTSTGALVVTGGVGVGGNVYANKFYGDGSTLSNIFANYVFNGQSYMGFGVANGDANISVAGTSNVVVVSNTTVTVSGTGGVSLIDSGTVGYGVGAGGSSSQSGGKTGAVTINKPAGEITLASGSLGADASATFTLTNSTIGSRDVMIINHVSGGTIGAYTFNAACSSGSASITVVNRSTGSLNEQPVIRFVVIKGSIT